MPQRLLAAGVLVVAAAACVFVAVGAFDGLTLPDADSPATTYIIVGSIFSVLAVIALVLAGLVGVKGWPPPRRGRGPGPRSHIGARRWQHRPLSASWSTGIGAALIALTVGGFVGGLPIWIDAFAMLLGVTFLVSALAKSKDSS